MGVGEARLSPANLLHLVVLIGEGVASTFSPDKSRLPPVAALSFLRAVIQSQYRKGLGLTSRR